MKYFTLFLFFPVCLFGQNWQLINLEDKFNFSTDDSDYITNTLWVDSTNMDSFFTTYFLNRIGATCDHCDSISADPETRFLERKGQFLGSSFFIDPSGGYHFSGDQDFSIYSRAPLDFSWVYQSNPSGDVIARIAQVDTMEIFGMLDSVKYIVLDELDTIILSKSFGLLTFPSTHGSFDLIGIEGRDLGEILPDTREFYDFQVGDVFQYRRESFAFSNTTETIRKVKILNREEQDSSIVYSINEIRSSVSYSFTAPPFYSYSNIDRDWTIDLTYDSPLNFLNEMYPQQLFDLYEGWDTFCGAPDDGIYTPVKIEKDSVTGRIIKSMANNTADSYDNVFFFLDDNSDILMNGYCIAYTLREHMTGLGEVYNEGEIIDNGYVERLVGYIKDGDTTGIITPDAVILSLENESLKKSSAIIHPNFSNGFFQLKTTEGHALEISIYYMNGQLVQSITDQRSGQDIELDLSIQPNGVYFVQVWLDDQFENIKIIKM